MVICGISGNAYNGMRFRIGETVVRNIAPHSQKSSLVTAAATMLALVTSSFFPSTALAINIGEIVSQSKMGQPLYIKVELNSGADENITDACLSLASPDKNDEEAPYYLVTAKLSLNVQSRQQYVIIDSNKSFNDAFAKLKLRINCPGLGSIAKTLTFLPDMAPSLALTQSSTLNIADEAAITMKQPSATVELSGNTASPDEILAPAASAAMPPKESAEPMTPVPRSTKRIRTLTPMASKSAKQSTRKKTSSQENYWLKLSSEPIDESRIGKITPEEREILLARQKMLDTDDQTASFLTLQNQVKLLQDELGEIRLKLVQLTVSSPAAAGVVADADGSHSPTFEAIQGRVLFSVGLVLTILALVFGLRYYNRINSRRMGEQSVRLQAHETIAVPITPDATAATTPPAPVSTPPTAQPASLPVKPPAPTKTQEDQFEKTQPIASPYAASMARAAGGSSSPHIHTKSRKELAEADSIIEEAELYAIYGHPERAALILKELLQQHPEKSSAWMLLLSILASLNKGAEFEQAARKFLRINNNNQFRKDVQTLGRSLERDNPLYDDGSAPDDPAAPPLKIAAGKRRLIGDILVESGVLSTEDMQKCLKDFDPKRDGRLGAFLISRNLVTAEQLEQALQLQQSDGVAPQPAQSDAQPLSGTAAHGSINYEPASPNSSPLTTTDVENLLSGLNPQQDERLEEYLKMDTARKNKLKKD